MVQKEVAQRICAQPGSKDYSAFSLFCQYYADPEIFYSTCLLLLHPPAQGHLCGDYPPVPDCTSLPIADEGCFFQVVHASFAQRRKTLVNRLSSGFGSLSRRRSSRCITAAGLPETVRSETLGYSGVCPSGSEIGTALKQQ